MFDSAATGVKQFETAFIDALNLDYNCQEGDKHLHFLSQAAPSAEKHHVISDWEVTGQSGASLNYSGVDSIQTLVAKKHVVPPVFLDIIWGKKACIESQSAIGSTWSCMVSPLRMRG